MIWWLPNVGILKWEMKPFKFCIYCMKASLQGRRKKVQEKKKEIREVQRRKRQYPLSFSFTHWGEEFDFEFGTLNLATGYQL